MNEKIRLDTKKIKTMLAVMGKNQVWLAEQIRKDRQYVTYDLQTGCLSRLHLYAAVFQIDRKDLIV
jgi:hypothetical protein